MTNSFPVLALLLFALVFAPSFAQNGDANRADIANEAANERATTMNDARGNENRPTALEARLAAAAFREDTAHNKGERIDGEFVLQLNADCENKCRGQLQKSINANRETAGCTVGAKQVKIGDVQFIDVKCPKGRNLRRDNVDAAVRPASETADVPEIALVEEDFVVTIDSVPTSVWGVDEADGGVTIQGGNPVRDGLRTCSDTSNNGQGVDVWILDTGCSPTFGGYCFGYYGGSCVDDHGHGNHVAGTATDAMYGVAPSARRNCVKVLNYRASGSYFIAISAIEYVVNNKGPNGNIINFSLSGPFYAPLNNAVVAAADQGVYFTLAAGNSGTTVCGTTPASVSHNKVFTVQAHDLNTDAAWFTNYATASADCTDISAPGVDITSYGYSGLITASGTSMAAPHVAGAISLLISDSRPPTLATLTASGVSIAPGGIVLSKPSLGVACT